MPLYDYICTNCSTDEMDRVYEYLVSLDEIYIDIFCPTCNNVLKRKDFYSVPGRVH